MRSEQWNVHLADVVSAAASAGWSWDGQTCLHLMIACADAVAPSAGASRHAADLAGGSMPDTRRRLLRVLANLGGLEAAVERCAKMCGFPEIDPDIAAGGDWGVAHFAGDAARKGMAEGVVRVGDNWAYRLPDVGVSMVRADVGRPARAWAVG